MRNHVIAFFLGFLIDLVLGDPYRLPHPVRLIGKLITGTEKILRGFRKEKAEKTGNKIRMELYQGIGLVLIVLTVVITVAFFLLLLAYRFHPSIGIAAECIMTYQILAVKCLKVE
ncbi:MAG: cobalamin biosynthesis protein, partial [Lachnospiraceae bacterium]|nr:cobalamin biosynthesis protein [Lachnospiraceae bacterium]